MLTPRLRLASRQPEPWHFAGCPALAVVCRETRPITAFLFFLAATAGRGNAGRGRLLLAVFVAADKHVPELLDLSADIRDRIGGICGRVVVTLVGIVVERIRVDGIERE